jgi:hypothetical protein
MMVSPRGDKTKKSAIMVGSQGHESNKKPVLVYLYKYLEKWDFQDSTVRLYGMTDDCNLSLFSQRVKFDVLVLLRAGAFRTLPVIAAEPSHFLHQQPLTIVPLDIRDDWMWW